MKERTIKKIERSNVLFNEFIKPILESNLKLTINEIVALLDNKYAVNTIRWVMSTQKGMHNVNGWKEAKLKFYYSLLTLQEYLRYELSIKCPNIDLEIISDDDYLKKCNDCGDILSSMYFHKQPTNKDGLSAYCAYCANKRIKELRK